MKLRPHDGGTECLYLNTCTFQLPMQDLREGVREGLCGRIDSTSGKRGCGWRAGAVGQHRRDIDDRATAARHHSRERGPRESYWGYGVQANQLLGAVRIKFEERGVTSKAGIVHE